MIGKHSKTFSGTAPASKAASLPGILWPPVSDRDSMTAIQAYTRQTPYEYCGNYEYIRGKLSRINTPTGYYENGRHYFYVKDYQGNVRCTVADNDSLTKAVHYYPGGSLFGESYGYYFWSGNNLFQGGKLEKSDAHTFYDLQNRHYDPILPHFISVDSKSESYYPFSFYNYALCNPVRYRDPDGNDAVITIDGNNIIISVNIFIFNYEYVNDKDKTPKFADLAKAFYNDIMNTWGEFTSYNYEGTKYDITWDVKVSLRKIDESKEYNGKNNYMNVKYSKGSEITNMHDGSISTKRYNGMSDMPHEFGHMLGAIDRYDESKRVAYSEWSGNIMGEPAGACCVEVRNLSEILDSHLKIYHGSINQYRAKNYGWMNIFGIWSYRQVVDVLYRNSRKIRYENQH